MNKKRRYLTTKFK